MNYNKFCIIVLFISFVGIQGYKLSESHEWFGEIKLDQFYVFKWSPDSIKKELTIRIEVKTKGWVSLGFSKHGILNELDMVIGWVDDNGVSHFNDYWVDQSFNTSLDRSQDWNLLSASENSTHTVLEFSRKYVTCDDVNDLQIYENEYEISNIVFAYNMKDPIEGKPICVQYQTIDESTIRGVFYRNLFTPDIPFKPKENDIKIIDYSTTVTLLPNKLKQVARIYKIEDQNNHMIIKFEPIYPDYVQNHHIAISKCDTKWAKTNYELHFKNKHFNCFNPDDPLHYGCIYCDKGIITMPILSTEAYTFPENVGIPLDGSSYIMIDGHFLNTKDQELTVRPTIRIWTTKQEREFAGAFFIFGLSLGAVYNNWGFIVPPRQASFRVSGVSTSYCLDNQNEMDDTGIFLFSILFHSHGANEMESRHYRNDKLLSLLHVNQYYYENQPWITLKTPINFRKTDKIVVTCDYNTLNKDKPLIAPREHCDLIFYYYPKLNKVMDRPISFTSMSYSTLLNITGLEQIDYFDGLLDETIIRKPSELNNTKLKDFINSNDFRIKNPKEFERTQLLANMNECCYLTKKSNEGIKPCINIGKPPGLYDAIMGWKKPNTCPS